MRQHKYRIWDKQQKEFHTDRDWGLSLDGTHIIGFSSHDSWNDDRGYKIKITKNLVVQDFIGLLDKHGKEIYEGDICAFSDWKLKPIVWRDGFFRLGNTDVLCCKMECDNMEVIGNIFENPDLLK